MVARVSVSESNKSRDQARTNELNLFLQEREGEALEVKVGGRLVDGVLLEQSAGRLTVPGHGRVGTIDRGVACTRTVNGHPRLSTSRSRNIPIILAALM